MGMFDIILGDKGFLHPNLAGNPVFKRFNPLGRQTTFEGYCVLPKKPIPVKVLSVQLWVFTSPEVYWDNVEAQKPIAKELLGVAFQSPEGSISWTVLADDFIVERGR
jgi:hypothetical protein